MVCCTMCIYLDSWIKTECNTRKFVLYIPSAFGLQLQIEEGWKLVKTKLEFL